MNVTAKKITSLEDAHIAIESTMAEGFVAKCSLEQLYRWEHSPSRTQMFWIFMEDVPTFVSVHIVRHSGAGKLHFVKSNRDDRGGEGDDKVNRLTPVRHRMMLNAQHLIDIARKRLCYKASERTRFLWERVQAAVYLVDPELARYMVPNCVYRGGYCAEPKPCGNYNVKVYNPDHIKTTMWLPKIR